MYGSVLIAKGMKTALNDTDRKPITCAGPTRFELPCRVWFLSTSSSRERVARVFPTPQHSADCPDSCKSGHIER